MVDPEERRAYWNERYASGIVFGSEPNQFVAELLADVPPGRALDMACGQGRNALWLARKGHDVTGLDLSDVALRNAAATATAEGLAVRFVAADVVRWEPEAGAYDLVLLSYLQLEEARRVVAHRKAVTALAPGGLLFLTAHHADNLRHGYGGPQRPELLYTCEQLAADFADLEIERNEQVIRRIVEDDVEHTARAVVLMARKRE